MREIPWETKFRTVLNLASDVIRDGNERLDLSDKGTWALASMVGNELQGHLDSAYFDGDDYAGCESMILHSWVEHGFTLEDYFPDWTAPQLMAAYACYLVSDAEQTLDDIPEPGETAHINEWGWRRDEIVEHCAGNIIEALEACRYGRQLIGQTITHDPEWLAQHVKQKISERASKGGKAKAMNSGTEAAKEAIREIWASGKYSVRDTCAEQEFAALGISYSTARKALRNTPDPS